MRARFYSATHLSSLRTCRSYFLCRLALNNVKIQLLLLLSEREERYCLVSCLRTQFNNGYFHPRQFPLFHSNGRKSEPRRSARSQNPFHEFTIKRPDTHWQSGDGRPQLSHQDAQTAFIVLSAFLVSHRLQILRTFIVQLACFVAPFVRTLSWMPQIKIRY